MAEEERDPGEEVLFEEVARKIQGDNYLGNPIVVKTLLTHAASDFCDKFPDADTDEERLAVTSKIAKRTGKILLGKDPRYTTVPGWNTVGVIDAFAAKWLGSSETDPHTRMEHGVVKMLNEVLDISKYAGVAGVLPEQWWDQIDEVIERYAGVFMGQSIPEQMGAILTDDEPGVYEEGE